MLRLRSMRLSMTDGLIDGGTRYFIFSLKTPTPDRVLYLFIFALGEEWTPVFVNEQETVI